MRIITVGLLLFLASCSIPQDSQPVSSSGISQKNIQVNPGSDGLTVEQRNIQKRLLADNKPGSIKNLYVISAFSGQVIIYSTVQGKITSGGKRLTPTSVSTHNPNNTSFDGIPVNIGGRDLRTGEVLQDDGTYGSSDPYIYWFDTKGVYHQHFLSGGQIVHVSDQPLAVHSVLINMELAGKE